MNKGLTKIQSRLLAAEALDLRCKGMQVPQMATKLGITTRAVYDRIRKGLKWTLSEKADQYRVINYRRLEELYSLARVNLIERIDTTPEGKEIPRPDWDALDRLLKIIDALNKTAGVYTYEDKGSGEPPKPNPTYTQINSVEHLTQLTQIIINAGIGIGGVSDTSKLTDDRK